MSFPSLQLRPISTSHYLVSGDVTIQDGAAIAPGVLLQADPDSRVIIRTGACIGIGSVLHAHQGVVEVGEGANIGAEVLLIGQVTIGAKACIGSATTILNSTIEWGRVVPPGSLIGDASRAQEELPAEELQATDTVIYPATEPATNSLPTNPLATQQPEPQTVEPEINTATPSPAGQTGNSGVNVYGQMYVNQMLVKMFPHGRRSSDSLSTPDPHPAPTTDPWDD